MTCALPENPSIDQLRNQARDLQRAVRSRDAAAADLVRSFHPDARIPALPLSTAQLVVARMYGFPSWPRLVAHLAVVAEHHRVHAELAAGADPADRFLDLACLTYTDDDGPHRWSAAREVLAAHPHLGGIHVATARADAPRVERMLAEGPASAEGGPQRWPALMHLAYARHDPDVPLDAVLRTARALLDHGADPNAGFLFRGLPTPFTVLTGAFGGGERDQPPHPHALPLAELLLQAGADPNDGQALYNRMFTPADDHLHLLLEHGLGRGDGGPWHARMPDATDSPAAMLREQLRWATVHGFHDRIRLHAAHDVDVSSPLQAGRTPAEIAALAGRTATVELLVSLGSPAPSLAGVDALVGAALAADRAAVERVYAAHPTALADTLAAHPGLVVRAVAAGRSDAVGLLVALGFSVDALARADLPIDEPWETGLHHAAGNGDVAMVEALLALGADPSIPDARFGGTALDWARHFDQSGTADLLDGR